jgi:hypothetical protein
MEISGVIHEISRVGDETETEETLCERRFTSVKSLSIGKGRMSGGGVLGPGSLLL